MLGLDANTLIAVIAAVFAGLSAAAAVGAVVAQYRLVPRPLWVDQSEPVRQEDGSIVWEIWISNRGTASAHDVRFIWRNNISRVEMEERQDAVLPFGEHFKETVKDLDDKTFDFLSSLGAWSVVVKWRQAPRIARVRSKVFYMKPPIRELGRQVVSLPDGFWGPVRRWYSYRGGRTMLGRGQPDKGRTRR